MIPKTDDGRVLFAIPWYGKVVVGTTDTPLDEISPEPKALDTEIDFILKTAGRYLARAPSKSDVLSIYAGLRPLAADPDNPKSTKEVSRRHKISVSKSGLLSIVGGKWTSYRRMAEETLDKGIKMGFLERRKCITKNLRLISNEAALRPDRLKIYGDNSYEIEKLIQEKPSLGEPLHRSLPYTGAEIIWICRNEMPLTLEDMLARRTRALFLDTKASIEIAPDVAAIMANEMGLSSNWEQEQIKTYNQLALNYL
jgi:glycerol-3-phosphate dehydrogenase